MPIRAQSIMSYEQEQKFNEWIYYQGRSSEPTYFNEETGIVLSKVNLTDKLTNQIIGKIVYTLKYEQENEPPKLLDIDLVLKNEKAVDIYFQSMMPKSSDADEFYEAVTADGCGHFELETVNRHIVDNLIDGTFQEVYLSAFPFHAEMYDDIRQLNKSMGIENEAFYLAEDFMAPSSIIGRSDPNETFTLTIGKVVDFHDVIIDGANGDLKFTIIYLDCQLGVIPVAINKELSGLDNLAIGKVLLIEADIKADFCEC